MSCFINETIGYQRHSFINLPSRFLHAKQNVSILVYTASVDFSHRIPRKFLKKCWYIMPQTKWIPLVRIENKWRLLWLLVDIMDFVITAKHGTKSFGEQTIESESLNMANVCYWSPWRFSAASSWPQTLIYGCLVISTEVDIWDNYMNLHDFSVDSMHPDMQLDIRLSPNRQWKPVHFQSNSLTHSMALSRLGLVLFYWSSR